MLGLSSRVFDTMNNMTETSFNEPRGEDVYYSSFVVDKPPTTIRDSAYSSPRVSLGWPSSDSMSDSGSGTWSSPPPSIAYSPSPRPADYHNNYLGWAQGHSGNTLQPFTSLNQVQYQPDAPEYFPACQPYYHTQYFQAPLQETSGLGIIGIGGWTAPESSEDFSEQATELSPAPESSPASTSSTISTASSKRGRPTIKQEPSESSETHLRTHPTSSSPRKKQNKRTTCTSTPTAFPCPLLPYGCPATFSSKNEWKRHLNTQHLHLSTWRCDLCPPKPSFPPSSSHTNDFNRKDLFVQHLRRMHCTPSSPTTKPRSTTAAAKTQLLPNTPTALDEAEARCHVPLRQPPTQCLCIFCPTTFTGTEAWAHRTEHISRHLETFRRDGVAVPRVENWNRDVEVEKWFLGGGDLVLVKGREGRGRVRVKRGRGRV